MYPKAYYTMTYQEFMALWTSSETYNEFLAAITTDFGQFAEEMKTVLYARWHEYEIAGETVGEQGDFILQTYYENRSYYKEMFDNYYKQFDYATTGLRKVVEMHSTNTNTGSVVDDGSSSNTDETRGIHVDLPNKQIDPDDIYTYPSDADKSNSESSTSNHNTRDIENQGASDTTNTYVDNTRFLEMKARALRLIRNLYLDFAEKFSDCFIHIF